MYTENIIKSKTSEEELAKLNFSKAPSMVTSLPGAKTLEYLKRSDQTETMARGAGRFPFVFAQGKGSTVKCIDGNTMIDITAGVAVNSVGRCHPRVLEAIQKQMTHLMHASDGGSELRTRLAEKIASIMPNGLKNNCVTFFSQGGSGAVETAIKVAKKVTGRQQIIAFHGAYHGVWTASGSLTTGENYHKGNTHIPDVIHVPFPYFYRFPFGTKTKEECEDFCADYLDYLLNTPYTGADDVAAVILESIQGEGGYIPLSASFIEKVKAACEKNGALFIADEVQAGAGRSGKMWVVEYTNVTPDIITWGKGLGGDLPMAGCTVRKDLALKISEGSMPNTFAANGISAAVCMTNIDILTEEDNALLNRVAELGKETIERLQKAKETIPNIGEVRGRGLMIGIELVEDPFTRKPLSKDIIGEITIKMLNKGIIMLPCGRYGNVFRLMPPLTITRELLFKACDILVETIKEIIKK
ncbi:MAG: aspartate aminotransferase family protein [Flavobacteriaceae bacterium]|jgi:4-aminobutyrate aminotransferase|nr:aspartate aminotransferase family protein [Flavobacteriaceae bacterium]